MAHTTCRTVFGARPALHGRLRCAVPVSRHHVRRCRLLSESVLAMPALPLGLPASTLQPLHWRWLHHSLLNGAAATAPHGTHGRPYGRRCQAPIAVCCARESAPCSVDVAGAHSGGDWACAIDSAAVRVRAGDARSACIETTATALPLAAPFALERGSCHSTTWHARQLLQVFGARADCGVLCP